MQLFDDSIGAAGKIERIFLRIQWFYYIFIMWSSFETIFVKDSGHFLMQAEKQF